MEEDLLVIMARHARWWRFYWSVWQYMVDGGDFISQYGTA